MSHNVANSVSQNVSVVSHNVTDNMSYNVAKCLKMSYNILKEAKNEKNRFSENARNFTSNVL
jgi:hypothetical protein